MQVAVARAHPALDLTPLSAATQATLDRLTQLERDLAARANTPTPPARPGSVAPAWNTILAAAGTTAAVLDGDLRDLEGAVQALLLLLRQTPAQASMDACPPQSK